MTRIAVELSLLTFERSSELRFARWDEFDLNKSLWRVPAKREEIKGVRYTYRGMKMKEEHIVPLSRQAMMLLEQLKQISGDKELLFPGAHNAIKVMSETPLTVHCVPWVMIRKPKFAGMVLGRWRVARWGSRGYGVMTR